MSWRLHAACFGRDDIDWFDERDYPRCREVCATCPVITDCLADALLEGRDQFGFRAGYTAREREKMGTRRHYRSEAVCGTDGGYYAHLRRLHTEPCEQCKAAHVDAARWRRTAR